MRKCLVTGGAGFIGSHLVRALLGLGHSVIVVDDLSAGRLDRLPEAVEFRQMSITDPLYFGGADIVFHLAALPRVQRSLAEPEATHRVNVDGTLSVLLAARAAGVRRVIFSSSSSVYGDQDRLPFVESMRPHPKSPYALHKLIGEQYCQLFAAVYGLESVCLRYFNVYGPDMDADGPYANLMPRFALAFRQGRQPVINGDGQQTRDFCYVDDVVAANLRAARWAGPADGRVFNIGSGHGHSVNEVATLLAKLMNVPLAAAYGPAVLEPRATCADVTRARLELGWKPTVGLADGLRRTLALPRREKELA